MVRRKNVQTSEPGTPEKRVRGPSLELRARGRHAALQGRFFRTLLKRDSNRPIRWSAVTRELQKSWPGWRDSLAGRVDSLWGFRRMPRLAIAKGNDGFDRFRPVVLLSDK